MPLPGGTSDAAAQPFAGALTSGDPQVDAMDRQTAQISRLADELRHARETVAPAVEAITNLDVAQKKLCAFVVGHRLKLAASVPLVLVTIGAISPNAAEGVSALLKFWGVQ